MATAAARLAGGPAARLAVSGVTWRAALVASQPPALNIQPPCSANQVARSAGPVKSSRALARASSCSSDRAQAELSHLTLMGLDPALQPFPCRWLRYGRVDARPAAVSASSGLQLAAAMPLTAKKGRTSARIDRCSRKGSRVLRPVHRAEGTLR